MSSELIQTRPRALDVRTGDFSRGFVEEISGCQDEPKWMRERRLEAYDVYESLLMPHTADDDEWRRKVDMRTQDYWRRTKRNMRGFNVDDYTPAAFSASDASETPTSSGITKTQAESNEESSGVIAIEDGSPVESFLSKETERKGVYFADLNTALKERPDLVRSYFMTKGGDVRNATPERQHPAAEQI